MTYKQQHNAEMSIKLYKNTTHVEGEDNRPVLTGIQTINGVDYKIALWRIPGSGCSSDGTLVPILSGKLEISPRWDVPPLDL